MNLLNSYIKKICYILTVLVVLVGVWSAPKNFDYASSHGTFVSEAQADFWDGVKAGDELAMEVAEKFGEYLGKGLAAVACVVNPEVFVIGGGVSKAGEVLIDYIRQHYETHVFHGSREAKFALATLGNDAGIYGAAKLVME